MIIDCNNSCYEHDFCYTNINKFLAKYTYRSLKILFLLIETNYERNTILKNWLYEN